MLGVRAVQAVAQGAPDESIEVREIDVPEPGPGEVRVAVSAASVNFGDIARTRGGVATMLPDPPFTLGMDVCGVVDAAGEGAEEWVGRRVVAMTKMAIGGMAEAAICPVTGVFDAPPELDDAEAAAFLLPFHTSYLALHRRAHLQPGEVLLVSGAASGVGTAAVQLGAAAGATVLALAGGPEKGRYCRELGAAASIDHHSDDVFERVDELTGGRGAEVVLDLVGGELTEVLWTCVALEGRYLPVGFNDDTQGGFTGRPLRRVSMGNFSVVGVLLGYSGVPGLRRMGLNPFPPEVGREVHAALCELVTAGAVRPAVGRRIAMEDVGAALMDHEQRRTTGRTVVEVGAR